MTIDLCAHHDDDFNRHMPSRTRSGIDGLGLPRPRTRSGVATAPGLRNGSTKIWLARGSPHTTWPCTGPPG